MELRGAVADLWDHDTDQTVVVEAGAGTGKTHGVCAFAVWFCEEHPGARVLFLRKVRVDLIQSTLVKPLESSILDLHLAAGTVKVVGGATRDSYVFDNGSVIVCGGLDKSSRHMGSQWDLIVIFEATEATLDDYEDLLTRTSREEGAAGQSFIILDCNPGMRGHWINQLAEKGVIKRLCSLHEDNPLLFVVTTYDDDGNIAGGYWTPRGAKYLAKLDALHGPRKRRLRFHEWTTSEGLVLEEYDPEVHAPPLMSRKGYEFEAFFGGFDWGHNDPGCLEVFGVRAGIAYRVYEVYRRRQGYPWWAERVVDIDQMLLRQWGKGFRSLVCSHERPELSDLVNDLLAGRCKDGPIAHKYRAGAGAPKARIERFRWYLRPSAAPDELDDGEENPNSPRVYLLPGSQLWGPDPDLVEDHQPTSLESELPGLVWAPVSETKRSKEEVDPKCPNHAVDAAGMALEEAYEYLRSSYTRHRQSNDPSPDSREGRELAMMKKLQGEAKRR